MEYSCLQEQSLTGGKLHKVQIVGRKAAGILWIPFRQSAKPSILRAGIGNLLLKVTLTGLDPGS
jgi:hypothetical protein